MSRTDVLVVGLGAMGSAIAAELAARGHRVHGFDSHSPPHDLGSSHGETRVIREAYWEHPLYVPLVQRAYELWHRLETDSGRRLLTTTGALLIGRDGGELISGATRSAEEHHLKWEHLSQAEIRERFPVLHPDPDSVGIFEPRAGALRPELCIRSFLELARARGADLHFAEPCRAWRTTDAGVEVTTDRETYRAERLVLAMGAWMPEELPGADLRVERQVMHWLEPPQARRFGADHLPIFLFEEPDGATWYGIPDLGEGLKVAIHHDGAATAADQIDRQVTPTDVAAIRELVERRAPEAAGSPVRSSVCMYTNTRDGHFLVADHPEHADVLVVSACSGHGFKFSSVIGEIVADLVSERAPGFDLEPFGWRADVKTS